jgi:hypothetical protein
MLSQESTHYNNSFISGSTKEALSTEDITAHRIRSFMVTAMAYFEASKY